MGKLFPFDEDMILGFFDMVGQHLQFGLLHPAEWLFILGVVGMVMGCSDSGGSSVFFSLALVRVFARFLFFFRHRHGVGTFPVSDGVGLSIRLICLVLI